MPFVENYGYLKPLLEEKLQSDEGTVRIIALGEEAARRKEEKARPEAFFSLTEREYEIVGLMAGRLSNREIAEKLFLSEGSVKQYINQIYSKLHIEGDTRVKRKQLADLFLQKT